MPEATYDEKISFFRFVYPFLFKSRSFLDHCQQIGDAQWEGQKGPFPIWNKGKYVSEDLLSYVANFLNPPEKVATARLWEINPDKALTATRGGLGAARNVEWTLVCPQGRYPFQIKQISLNLFQVGVGFLILEVKPEIENCSLEGWLNFAHYFRFTRGDRRTGIAIRSRRGINPDTREPLYEPFYPDVCGGVEHHPEGQGYLADIIDGLLSTASLPNGPSRWYQDVFVPNQMLPFEVLFVKDMPAECIPMLTYQARNFFHAEEGKYAASEDLRLDNPALLVNAPNQWFFFSLDGGGYIAVDNPKEKFFSETLPEHLRKTYFLLFILALQQRFALMMLLDEVAENCPINLSGKGLMTDLVEREKAFNQIRDKLMAFTARGYFTQVMQKEHHHRCYRKWQETFQVAQLYGEVSDEIRYVSDLLQDQHEMTLSRIAWIIGIPVLGLTFLQAYNNLNFVLALITLVVCVVIGIFFYRLSGKITFK